MAEAEVRSTSVFDDSFRVTQSSTRKLSSSEQNNCCHETQWVPFPAAHTKPSLQIWLSCFARWIFLCVHLQINFKIRGKWSHVSKLTCFPDMYSTQPMGNSKPGSPCCRNGSSNCLWRSQKQGWNNEFSPQVGNRWDMGVWFFIMTRIRKIHSEAMTTHLLHKSGLCSVLLSAKVCGLPDR